MKKTLEAFEIEAPVIGRVKSVKVRLNNQVNYHQNLTNEEITGLFVSSEDSPGDFYYNSNENNNSGELTSGALYKIVLYSNCKDEEANSSSSSDELFLTEESSETRIKILNQHSKSSTPFENQKAIFFTSGPETSKFAKYKISDESGKEPSYLRSFLVQTSSTAGLDGIVWESPKSEILNRYSPRRNSSSADSSESYSEITAFTAPEPPKIRSEIYKEISPKKPERVLARPLHFNRPDLGLQVLQESNRAIPAEFSDLSVLSKCKTRRERRDLKENKGTSKRSSSLNLYEYAGRRNETENINEDLELKGEKVSSKFDEDNYHSDVVIEDQFLEKSCIYKFGIKTSKKFFSSTITRATLGILNDQNERIEFFLANQTHLKKRGKDEPISLDGIYSNSENEYSFEIVDSFGRLSAIQLDLSKNLSVDFIKFWKFSEDMKEFSEIALSHGGKQKLHRGVNSFSIVDYAN